MACSYSVGRSSPCTVTRSTMKQAESAVHEALALEVSRQLNGVRLVA